MGTFLNFSDLSPLAPSMTQAQADLYIKGIEARALIEAPCLSTPDFPYTDAVQDILREAVLRRHRAGEGGVTTEQQSSGPFSLSTTFDTSARSNGALSRAEVRQLKALCRLAAGVGDGRKAFTVRPR